MLLFVLAILYASSEALEGHQKCEGTWKFDATEKDCLERGCVWSLLGCHYPPAPKQAVKKIHVIQGSHVDVGFSNDADIIVNTWFDEHVPRAFETGKTLADEGGVAQLQYMTQSWFISFLFDCIAHPIGVHCENRTDLQLKFKEAASKGWITWHSFPFNSQLEVYDEATLVSGLNLTHALDDLLGVARKTVISQRDVPGTTSAIIPILKKHGVDTISIGSNGGSTPPNVAPFFRWKSSDSDEEVRVIFHWGGYGGVAVPPTHHVVNQIPGTSDAIVVHWRGDNSGPPSAGEVKSFFESVQKQHPHAEIVSASFESVAEILRAVPTGHLPLVENEIGDTWIHGVASDPYKLGRIEVMQDTIAGCVSDGICDETDERLKHFRRLLLKNGEHTWGDDQKVILSIPVDRANWSNIEFASARASNPRFGKLEQSWANQRRWGIENALEALADHPLAHRLDAAFKSLATVAPDLQDFSEADPRGTFTCGRFNLTFNPDTGAVSKLYDSTSQMLWAGDIGAFEYRTYSAKEFTNFLKSYNFIGPLFYFDDYDDFDKVGLSHSARARTYTPTLQQFWSKFEDNTCEFRTLLSLPADSRTYGGAPADVWVSISVGESVRLRLDTFNKTRTRLPEAAFLHFNIHSDVALTPTANKISSTIDARRVQSGGNHRNHHVGPGGISFTDEKQATRFNVRSTNARLAFFGTPTALPVPLNESPEQNQFGYVLWNNIWNTNYPSWYPFLDSDADSSFLFEIKIERK